MSDNEEKIVKEEVITLPLREAFTWARTDRTPRAIRIIKKYIKRHFKIKDDQIMISQKLNELLWRRSKKKTLKKIKVLVQQTDKQIIKVLPAR